MSSSSSTLQLSYLPLRKFDTCDIPKVLTVSRPLLRLDPYTMRPAWALFFLFLTYRVARSLGLPFPPPSSQCKRVTYRALQGQSRREDAEEGSKSREEGCGKASSGEKGRARKVTKSTSSYQDA
uniref:Uncharacterized protein n=1 Tax=Knipowitschia caucasica TaxID=637954 RepID=A0AAV2JFP9_KNICA